MRENGEDKRAMTVERSDLWSDIVYGCDTKDELMAVGNTLKINNLRLKDFNNLGLALVDEATNERCIIWNDYLSTEKRERLLGLSRLMKIEELNN